MPKRRVTNIYKRAAMILALIQIKIPSERKIKEYPRPKGCTTVTEAEIDELSRTIQGWLDLGYKNVPKL